MDKPGKHYLEAERKVIHLMLKSRDAIEEILDDGISLDYFDTHHQLLVKSVFSEYMNSNKKRLLTRQSYRQQLVDAKAGGDLMENLTVYDRCFIQVFATLDDLGHLKKLLVEGFISRECYFMFEKFKKKSKSDGFLTAAHDLSDSLKNVLGITDTGRTTVVSLSEIKDEFIEDLEYRKNNQDKVVRTGLYPEIDDAINVGFRPQHLTLFVADVGGHKTNMMLNISLALFERGHSILFIPLEMSRLDLMSRVIANRAKINYNKLARPEMLSEEDWEKIRNCKIWMKNQNRFCILDADERTSVSRLQQEIEKRSLAFRPDVVVIDYVANLMPDRRFGDRNDLEIGEILKSLRFLGKKHGFHVISAAQMGRGAIKAMRDDSSNVPDSTSIRGSHEYSADSDTIFGLLKVKDEPDKIKLAVIKARHGPSGGSPKILQVQPEFCMISSTQNMNAITSGSDENIFDLEGDLNEPIEKIAEETENKAKIKFVHADFDDIGELGG